MVIKESGKIEEGEVEGREEGKGGERTILSGENKHFIQLSEVV